MAEDFGGRLFYKIFIIYFPPFADGAQPVSCVDPGREAINSGSS